MGMIHKKLCNWISWKTSNLNLWLLGLSLEAAFFIDLNLSFILDLIYLKKNFKFFGVDVQNFPAENFCYLATLVS